MYCPFVSQPLIRPFLFLRLRRNNQRAPVYLLNSFNQIFYYILRVYFHSMAATHPYLRQLLAAIALEEREEIKRYSLDQQHTLSR